MLERMPYWMLKGFAGIGIVWMAILLCAAVFFTLVWLHEWRKERAAKQERAIADMTQQVKRITTDRIEVDEEYAHDHTTVLLP